MKLKISGIYKIENKTNGKVYIGRSIDIDARWAEHKRNLLNGTHHSKKLQNSYNLHGIESFAFSIIEEVDRDRIVEAEQKYIDLYDCINVGYNIIKKASPDFPYRSTSEDTREKLSRASKGKKRTDATKKIMSDSHLGDKCIFSKISDNDALEIRRLYLAGGISQAKLGAMFGITAPGVCAIVNNKVRVIDNSYYNNILADLKEIKQANSVKLNHETANAIRTIFRSGKLKAEEISGQFGIGLRTFYSVIYYKSWKDIDSAMIKEILFLDSLGKAEISAEAIERQRLLRVKLNNFKEFGSSKHRHTKKTKQAISKAHAGEKAYFAKLTEADVCKIKEICASSNISQSKIAKKFGVTPGTISMIVTNKTWGSLSDDAGSEIKQPIRIQTNGVKLNYDKAQEIRKLREIDRLTFQAISDLFGVTTTTIMSVVKNKLWKAPI